MYGEQLYKIAITTNSKHFNFGIIALDQTSEAGATTYGQQYHFEFSSGFGCLIILSLQPTVMQARMPRLHEYVVLASLTSGNRIIISRVRFSRALTPE
jgi:hypothetical protein